MRIRIVLIVLAGSVAFASIAKAFFGELDPSFDGDGKVVTDGPGNGREQGEEMVIQSDGKIVVAGWTDTDPTAGENLDLAVLRYNTDGSLDSSFDGDSGTGNGIVTIPFGSGEDDSFSVAIQPDDKIVVAGEVNMGATGFDIGVARLNTDGTLDDTTDPTPGTSFDTDGKRTDAIGPGANEDYAAGVAIQPDGKIVVAGAADLGGANGYDFAVVRYNDDGTLDPGFDGDSGTGNGIVTTDFTGASPNSDESGPVAIQPDGKLVVGGNVFTGGSSDFALARYSGGDGKLDTGFDGDGKVVTSFAGIDGLRDIAIQGDGKIVAAGFAGTPRAFALGRYLPADGSLDPSFDGDGGSGNGKVMTFLTAGTVFASGLAIAIDADAKLVVAGAADTDPGAGIDEDFGIARFNPGDGTLDSSFACDGTTTTAVAPAGNNDFASGLAVQTDGKIVAAGLAEETAGVPESDDFALVRYGPGALSCPGTTVPVTTTPSSPSPPPATCAGKPATRSGTDGGDQIAGTPGADVIVGEGGNDTLSGLAGNDVICGGAGKDTLKGGKGNDKLLGGAGKDTLMGGPGKDKLKGGAGKDKQIQ